MTNTAGAPLSAGTLLYLWGDQVVGAPGRLQRKVTLPSGAVVGAADLAAQVFAVSFWRLSAQRVVGLEPSKRRSMGVLKKDDVAVTLTGEPGRRDGYEAAVLTVIAKEKGVYGAVRRWFGSDVSNPSKVVLGLAREELPAHGLARMGDAGRGLISGMLRGSEELHFDAEAIRGTWTDFHRMHEAWRGFRDHDPLGTVLVETCRKAIASREESSE